MPCTNAKTTCTEINDGEVTAAFEAILPLASVAVETAKAHVVSAIGDAIVEILTGYMHTQNPVTAEDEGLFTCYEKIMEKYEQAAACYAENMADIDNALVSEILGGTCDIISERVSLFEEYKNAQNPIKSEKDSYVSQMKHNLATAVNGFANVENVDIIALLPDLGKDGDIYRLLHDTVCKQILSANMENLYMTYKCALFECADSMSDLSKRPKTEYFYDTLHYEKDSLLSIVKVQLKALEHESHMSTPEEIDVIESVCSTIKEAYTLALNETQKIKKAFTAALSALDTLQILDISDFEVYIKNACAFTEVTDDKADTAKTAPDMLREAYNAFYSQFTSYVQPLIAETLDAKPHKRFVYHMHKQVTNILILTDEMAGEFQGAIDFYEQNSATSENSDENCAKNSAEKTSGENSRILSGINESFQIKLETLKEGKDAFDTDTKAAIDGVALPAFTEDDRKMFLDCALPAWTELYGKENKKFKKALKEIGNVKAYNEKLAANIESGEKKVKKIEAAYLKNCLLPEVATFEEIMTYSVSRLRESGDDTSVMFAIRCDKLKDALFGILKRHNIDVIEPAPGNAFNPQEHEVLLAEKADGFARGQIIKSTNSGFKFDGVVLIRANVIAAKG